MYYYAELLRAKRALYIAGILIALFVAIGVIVRIAVGSDGSYRDWPSRLSSSPTAHVSKSVLPDGTRKTIVDDGARQTHATILQHPDNTYDMDVTEPVAARSQNHISMGNMSMNENVYAGGTMRHVRMHYKEEIPSFPLGVLFLTTIPMGLIVATCLGGPLSKENDGHLELAWTKPVSRERYAMAAFAVDSAAIIIAQCACVFAALLTCLLFFVPKIHAEGNWGWAILIAFVGPLALYGLLTAASTSIKRGPGMVIGLGWVLAILIPGISQALKEAAQVNAVAAAFHAIFQAVSYLDPLTYFSFNVKHDAVITASGLSLGSEIGILAALFVGYLALSVAQWRRVEA